MYTIRQEGEGVVIVPPDPLLDGVYIPKVGVFAYLELEKLINLANRVLEKENK